MRKYGGEVSERGAYSTEFTIIYYSSRRFLLFIYILFIYCYDFFLLLSVEPIPCCLRFNGLDSV